MRPWEGRQASAGRPSHPAGRRKRGGAKSLSINTQSRAQSPKGKPKINTPARVNDKKILIPKDFYQNLPADCENFQLSFLEFDHERGQFAKECQMHVDGDQPLEKALEIKEVRTQKDSETFLPFVGDGNTSKVPIIIDGAEAYATVDTGCQSSVVASSLADRLIKNWKRKIRKDRELFAGPTGNTLKNLGHVNVIINIAGKSRTLKLNVIQGEAESILLGNPALKKLGALISAGEGISLKKDPITLARVKKQSPENQNRSIAIEDADMKHQTLEALAFEVKPTRTHIIQPFGKEWVKMVPRQKINTRDHNFQKFILRPCCCILKGEECKDCKTAATKPPFQLVTLENNEAMALFNNLQASPWEISESQDYSLEFQAQTYSCKELAQNLLEHIEQDPLESPYTKEETRDLFDLSVEDFKAQLHNIICEPSGFQDGGFREPILKLQPERQEPSYSKRGISIEDYLSCNPCTACKAKNLTVCDATIEGCLTKQLYEPGLKEDFESRLLTHGQQCDLFRQLDQGTTFIICNRGGMSTLHKILEEKHPGYTTSQGIYTDESGKSIQLLQSHFPNHQTINSSTVYLKQTNARCRDRGIHNLHFPNFEDFGISRQRLQRIFHEKCFTLHLYERDPQLFRIFPHTTTQIKKNSQAGTMPLKMPPKVAPLEMEPGLPKSFHSKEVEEKKKFGEATILCNSEKIKEETIKLMDSHRDLWSRNEWSVGTFRDKKTGRPVYFQLQLKSFEPVLQSPRFISQNKQEPARALIGGLLDNGVIEPCYTRYAQNSVFVPKKTKRISPEEWVKLGYKIEDYTPNQPHPEEKTVTYRHTLDWSDLNRNLATLPIAAADPRAIFNSIQDNSLISVMDLACAYHSLLLSPRYTNVRQGTH